jgi:subtilisin family serine protease
MSLNAGPSSSFDNAVANLVAAGVTVVVAAGNSAVDACGTSPARAPNAITVGASDVSDHFATFSNYGSCLDLSAPGVAILSDYVGSTTATAYMDGTSMAAPHVAGAAALYLSTSPTATPAQVTSALLSNATPNVIGGAPSSTTSRLLFVGFLAAAANQPPSATITSPPVGTRVAAGTTVTLVGTATDPEDGVLPGTSLTWTSSINGALGSGTSLSTTSLSAGVHTITLTARDSKGATGTAVRTLTVVAPTTTNQPPVASFTWTCVGQTYPHQCAFDGTSSTDDVNVVSWKWSWGDGRTETHTAGTAKNTWAAAGTYNVTLTVADGSGLTSSVTRVVVVP